MSQQPRSPEGAPRRGEELFYLASELGGTVEQERERRRERRRRLEAAGMLMSGGMEEWPRGEDDICGPAPSYPQGVSPADGSLHWGA
jgi:hypothetical protein